jgi:uncharacterized membrane protein YeaQ/YmgE (transglycosylase-associated protein family)
MLDFGAWVLVGITIGWLSSRVMQSTPSAASSLNIVVGVTGACLAALIITPLLGAGLPQEGTFSLPALVVALFGALGLLLVLNPSRRGNPSQD